MKKLQSFISLVTLLSFLLMPIAPAFALGGVDLGTTNTAPTVVIETVPPTAPTVQTTTTITTPEPTTTITPPPTTETTSTTTVGSTTVSTNTSTSTTPSTSVTISDTTPPVISDIISASVLPTEATVAWVTDELAVSHFRYGTTTSYGSTVTLGTSGALIHAATMLNLTAGTTYHYCIDATDLFGNSTESCGHQFTTAAQALQADTNPPTISLVTVAPITTTSARISWTTDELANGHVQYGTTESYGSMAGTDTDYTLLDTTTLSNLTPNTTYHYRVTTRDEIGNTSVTPDETFTTDAIAQVQVVPTAPVPVVSPAPTIPTPPADTTAPVISLVATNGTSATGTIITWTTNELANSEVEFGTTTGYGSTTILNNNESLTHTQAISNLEPSTMYHYRVLSADASNNLATSADYTFTTSAGAVTVLLLLSPSFR